VLTLQLGARQVDGGGVGGGPGADDDNLAVHLAGADCLDLGVGGGEGALVGERGGSC